MNMNTKSAFFQQRIWAVCLVVLQAIALAIFHDSLVFTPLVILVGIVGLVKDYRFISPRLAQRLPIVMVILYAIQRTLLPASVGTQSFLVPGGALIAQYFVLYQLAMLFVRSSDGSLPPFLPIMAFVAIVFVGDVRVNSQERTVFQFVSLALVLISIGYFFASRVQSNEPVSFTSRHKWLLAIVGSFCCFTAWASASALYRYSRQIEATMNAMINPSFSSARVGFSGTGHLGSVARQKEGDSDAVSLRIVSEDAPGYLRGKAMDVYNHGRWDSQAKSKSLLPVQFSYPASEQNAEMEAFQVSAHALADPIAYQIWPNHFFRDVVFTPFGVTTVHAPVDQLSVDIHAIASADTMPPDTPYSVDRNKSSLYWTVRQDVIQIADSDWERLKELPDDFDVRIRDLAKHVVGEAVTTGDRIAAVENYFLDNYQYQIGTEIPNQRDPLEYFLLERPPAHCEYFASGAVVLLRAVGVPCRYVTGFVASEKNEYGDYWIARNRDAHAWAEAYDPDSGWVLVEATPTSGIPQSSSPASSTGQLWDAARMKLKQTIATICDGGVQGIINLVGCLMLHPLSLLILAGFAVVSAIRFLCKRKSRTPSTPEDPRRKELARLLDEMDRRWRRDGITRLPHETLHQFATRLEIVSDSTEHQELADWYRRFAAIRYSGRINAEALESLQS